MVHNYYQQRGGEDESAEQDFELLKRHGHDVRSYCRHNDEIKNFGFLRRGLLFFEPSWSLRSCRELAHIIQEFHPEIVHFQNIFPLISPAAYYTSRKNRVPVVQTLRNYRLFCPDGLFLRNDSVCKECLTFSLWQSVRYGCYRNSRIQTASVALMLAAHRMLRTWEETVDCYIALSDFSRQNFLTGGIPQSKVHVRPNFLITDPEPGHEHRDYSLFVGRLSQEKGLITLLKGWKRLAEAPLKIIGDGPLRSWIERYIDLNRLAHVELLGRLPFQEVKEYLRKAIILVNPSLCYETSSRTIIEAYATATPVIASRNGALGELVKTNETGLLFRPGDDQDLANKVRDALEHPAQLGRWGREARRQYEEKYAAKRGYSLLMEIYHAAIAHARNGQEI
jgi:glycosyltransferase involved in cell wall biosynthesis